ncbi:hypothetical protein M3N64_01640 [Sporolactobacillus sp. CPB3-1]|uniref:Uncharacterized protein n=1 Tax=Sporolactobacillus mangiferae TaxID=2940498 RepID=A0ABT0M721_9BACL|nr:hypothetical protein [Sporolactobacillus mangiferae]MCL1630656.1 hypothetical protein [Sporolactobacillus mangiferae]
MYSNDSTPFSQPDARVFQPSSAPRGWIGSTADGSAGPIQNEQAPNTQAPFPSPRQPDTTSANQRFVWNGYENKRQMMPQPRPPFNPQQWEQRLQRIERQQQHFQQELQRLDQRVRTIERRLGFPVPPIGGPTLPPR